jgi:hypothetical protein
MKLYPLLLASLVSASVAWGAIDFFALPEKIVVPKSVTPSTAPDPPPPAPTATPAPLPPTSTNPRPLTPPLPPEEAPVLTFDGRYLKTPFVGTENPSAQSFYDVGPNQGVLIGFQYTTGQNEAGGTGIESLTPLFLRSAGKMTGITRGPRGERPATVLEARPGYAVARVEIRAASVVEAMWITFARYENGALDHSESYKSEVIGGRGAHASQTTVRLRTDTRPFVGMYGKASNGINQFGLLVRPGGARRQASRASPTFHTARRHAAWKDSHAFALDASARSPAATGHPSGSGLRQRELHTLSQRSRNPLRKQFLPGSVRQFSSRER